MGALEKTDRQSVHCEWGPGLWVDVQHGLVVMAASLR